MKKRLVRFFEELIGCFIHGLDGMYFRNLLVVSFVLATAQCL